MLKTEIARIARTMNKQSLPQLLQAYLNGHTYEYWASLTTVSRGAINNAATGRTPRPHPDTLAGIAHALQKAGKGNAEEIYLELMDAAGYLKLFYLDAESRSLIAEAEADSGIASDADEIELELIAKERKILRG